MNRAQEGDIVTIAFQGVLEDGTIFDTFDENEPLTFVLGDNQVLPGLEMAVSGMTTGEQKTVIIPPEEGYGLRQTKLVEEVAIEALPEGLELNVGGQLEVTTENGTPIHLLIIERNTQTVTLDANHPLAGRPLTLQIEVLAINRPTFN